MSSTSSQSPFDFGSHRGWLLALLAFDFACALYMFLWATIPALKPHWYLNMAFDLSVPEFVQYAKALATAFLLFRAGKGNRSPLLTGFGAFYVYLALDDGLGLHEGIGGRLLGSLLFGSSDEAYHEGQVVYAVLVLAVVAPALLFLARGQRPEMRSAGLYFAGTLALLGLAAVVIDFGAGFVSNPTLRLLTPIAEESGEHLAMTFALWLALILKKE